MNIAGAPDSFISKLAKKDQPHGWMSYAEAKEKFMAGQERKLQNLITNYLSNHGIYFESDRMDKRTRGKNGRPDFRVCYRGRFLAIECKAMDGRLSSEQASELARIRNSGGMVVVAMSLENVRVALGRIEAELQSGDQT